MNINYINYKKGPIKLDRCQKKIENDYKNEIYPNSSKLLDIIRGAITFENCSNLIKCYYNFIEYINNNQTIFKLSRVKNSFIDNIKNKQCGYRDIKVNITYYSNKTKCSQICEIQFILLSYLNQKKKCMIYIKF